MKRFLALSAAVVMALSITACTENETATGGSDKGTVAETSAPEADKSTENNTEEGTEEGAEKQTEAEESGESGVYTSSNGLLTFTMPEFDENDYVIREPKCDDYGWINVEVKNVKDGK